MPPASLINSFGFILNSFLNSSQQLRFQILSVSSANERRKTRPIWCFKPRDAVGENDVVNGYPVFVTVGKNKQSVKKTVTPA
ncbi:hypothetical protein FB466_0960 [Klugiella xanthotipulae]|uniref:Uncharacterized protein n=1 Tax=Klugiella xanthotipulae TaxID=244735 RepID=A0A543I699_9MICO|nr:hypothetical protein FB466_0960 [Klugiella xanthotipulae]